MQISKAEIKTFTSVWEIYSKSTTTKSLTITVNKLHVFFNKKTIFFMTEPQFS